MRIGNLEAWVAQITTSVDELRDGCDCTRSEKADRRIAELAVAQEKTEKLLQTFISSRLTNGHTKSGE